MTTDPWERQSKETAKSFAAFAKYRDLGPNRSVRRLLEENPHLTRAAVEALSVRHHWVARAEAWDAAEDEQFRLDQAVARKKMAEQHARVATAMLGKAVQRLGAINPESLSARDLVAWVDAAVKIERQARGVADAVEITGKDGGPVQVEHLTDQDVLNELALIQRELSARLPEPTDADAGT